MKKTSAINVINELPREFSLDELIEKLIVMEKIDEAKKEVRKGKGISHDRFKHEVKKWLK